jgi:hypothetical protein
LIAGLWNAKAACLCKWGLSSLPRGLTSLAVPRYRHGALLSYTRAAYGHSSALEYRRTRTKHCPKGPDTKGGLWGSWPLELRCTMAVFGNPEGCGNELGKPSLGGDSRRIMHPNQGRYPGVGAPIGAVGRFRGGLPLMEITQKFSHFLPFSRLQCSPSPGIKPNGPCPGLPGPNHTMVSFGPWCHLDRGDGGRSPRFQVF